jgi:hypothetical protein
MLVPTSLATDVGPASLSRAGGVLVFASEGRAPAIRTRPTPEALIGSFSLARAHAEDDTHGWPYFTAST